MPPEEPKESNSTEGLTTAPLAPEVAHEIPAENPLTKLNAMTTESGGTIPIPESGSGDITLPFPEKAPAAAESRSDIGDQIAKGIAEIQRRVGDPRENLTIGRMVRFRGGEGRKEFPAVIVSVVEDLTLDLSVLTNEYHSGCYLATGVKHSGQVTNPDEHRWDLPPMKLMPVVVR